MSGQVTATHSVQQLPREIADVLTKFDKISQKRFETDFETLARNPDRTEAAYQMRFVLGVALKKDFSDGRAIKRRGRLVDYKWRIDPDKLKATPDDAWTVRILEFAPDRRPGETGKDVALRLKRETFLARCFIDIIHPYLCQTPDVRRRIRAILKESGLGEFTELASPKGVLKLGAPALYGYLGPVLGALPGAAVAVTAVALCVIGLDRICRGARSRQRSGHKASVQTLEL